MPSQNFSRQASEYIDRATLFPITDVFMNKVLNANVTQLQHESAKVHQDI